ncbi:MAG: hypothetical protein KBD21_04190 [Candidatus Pacebacteria bacterium]|nr:hypothetical protein [Candidatus Paceibacterota bacterium]
MPTVRAGYVVSIKKKPSNTKTPSVVVYQTKSGALELRDDFSHETIWAMQKQIAEVFEVDVLTINEHCYHGTLFCML